MNPKLKSALKYLLVFGLAVFLLWFMLKGIADKKEDILKAFRQANYFWICLSITAAFFSHLIRANRWKLLLAPLGHQTKLSSSVQAVFVGYLANYAVPRMGEISRCTVISASEKVPFQTALGTVVTERIIDFFVLILVFLLTLLLQFSQFYGLTHQYILQPLQQKWANLREQPLKLSMLLLAMLLFVLLFIVLRKKIKNTLSGKFGNLIKGFADGIGSVRKIKQPVSFVAQSLLIWFMYFLGIYFCLFALPETAHLGMAQCLTILLFGTFGVIFTPGGLGAYHLIVVQILLFYGVQEHIGFAYAWLVWGAQFITVLVFGLISLFLITLKKRQNNEPA